MPLICTVVVCFLLDNLLCVSTPLPVCLPVLELCCSVNVHLGLCSVSYSCDSFHFIVLNKHKNMNIASKSIFVSKTTLWLLDYPASFCTGTWVRAWEVEGRHLMIKTSKIQTSHLFICGLTGWGGKSNLPVTLHNNHPQQNNFPPKK